MKNKSSIFNISFVNVSMNEASMWTGGLRIDRAGGLLKNFVFSDNKALVCGGFFDYTWFPQNRTCSFCIWRNNSAITRGGGVTHFHIRQVSTYINCIFIGNHCEKHPNSISVQSYETHITLSQCWFSGEKDKEIGMNFEGQSFFHINDTQFQVLNSKINEELKIINSYFQQVI